MYNLLDRHGVIVMDISGDGFELRQEFFVIKGDLGIIGFTLTQRIGIGALIGYYAATGFGDYFGAGRLNRLYY